MFLPAGMHDTGYKLPGWPTSRIAVGYHDGKRWGRITEKPWADDGPYWALRANGGIHSTLDDMLRWHVALSKDTVLSAAEREKMFHRHVSEGPGSDTYYGYGWSIGEAPWGGRLIEHNGGNGTFYADFLRFVDDDLVVILSTNDSQVRGGTDLACAGPPGARRGRPGPEGGHRAPRSPSEPRGAMRSSARGSTRSTRRDMDAMRAFRAAHQTPRPGMDDAERERRLTRMREDIGKLDPEGIVEDTGDQVSVRAKGSNGPIATLKFMFAADGKVDGIGVELGN